MNYVNLDSSLIEVIQAMKFDPISKLPSGFAIVVDEYYKVLGVISDSDIRKQVVLSGKNPMDLDAKSIMRSDFLFLYDFELDSKNFSRLTSMAQARKIDVKTSIQFIPILDSEMKIVRVLHITDLIQIWQNFEELVVVFGLGFVGLTFALSLAEKGKSVIGVDSDITNINDINELNPRIYEPEIDGILKNTLGSTFKIYDTNSYLATDFRANPAVYIVCVGTPFHSGKIVTSQIENSVESIISVLKKGDTVILRSTIPVGYSRKVAKKIMEKTNLIAGIDFYFGYAPERSVEGNAIKELINVPQIYCGLTDTCSSKIEKVFDSVVNSKIKCESLEACELGKLMSNAFRDVTFAFANELSIIAQQFNLDINKLIDEVNTGYPRNNIAKPSPGVGGPCLTKDSNILLESINLSDSVINVARKFNGKLPEYHSNQLLRSIKGKTNPKILIIGLAFKGEPETKDTRRSTSIEISKAILSQKVENLEIQVYDHMLSEGEINKLELIPFKPRGDWKPNSVLILNNHPKNFSFFKEILKDLDSVELFDPWYLCSSLFKDPKLKVIKTLSKTLYNND
jgi:nucleotide sugar dehydrogenase